MVFTALVRLVIFIAEHVYSENPGDRFSAQGVISHNKLVIYNWYKTVWVYMKHGVYSKQYSLAKHDYVGCFSPKSMVSSWMVSYLLVYTLHTPLHYLHAAKCRVWLDWCSACALAQASDYLIKRRQVVFLCWTQRVSGTESPVDWMPAHKPTELSRIKIMLVMPMTLVNLIIFGSGNDLLPVGHQAITWSSANTLSIEEKL